MSYFDYLEFEKTPDWYARGGSGGIDIPPYDPEKIPYSPKGMEMGTPDQGVLSQSEVVSPSAPPGGSTFGFDSLAPGLMNYVPQKAPASAGQDYGSSMPEGLSKLGASEYGGYIPQEPTSGGTAGATGDLLNQMGNAGVATGDPIAAGIGLGTKVVGTGLKLYGAYQAQKSAERNYRRMMEEWKRQQAVERQDREREELRQQRQEGFHAGEYSQNLQDRFAKTYGGYRTPTAGGGQNQ